MALSSVAARPFSSHILARAERPRAGEMESQETSLSHLTCMFLVPQRSSTVPPTTEAAQGIMCISYKKRNNQQKTG